MSGDILNAVGVFRAASKIIRSGRVFDKLHHDAINPHGFQSRRSMFVVQIVFVKRSIIKRERKREERERHLRINDVSASCTFTQILHTSDAS